MKRKFRPQGKSWREDELKSKLKYRLKRKFKHEPYFFGSINLEANKGIPPLDWGELWAMQDVVMGNYPDGDYRVKADGIRATFMVYEIILAIKRAAEMAGIKKNEVKRIFYDNGMKLLRRIKKHTE